MKAKMIKSTISVIILLVAVVSAMGQGTPVHLDPKYGKDSASRIECAKNISLYSEFYKQNNFKDAVKPWRYVYRNGPSASKNTYIKGASIYKNLIAREKDETTKQLLIDTLMMIYDQRIEYFADKGTVLSYKAADLYGYKGDKAAAEVYSMLKEAMEIEGKESKAAIVSIFMQTAVSLYKNSKIQGDEVITAYTFAMETLEKATKYNKSLVAKGGKYGERGQKELENIDTSVNNVEALFSESGAANCNALIAIFEPKFAENNNDIDWLKKTTKVLDNSDCTDSPLFAKASEQLYKLEPSSESAHNLARLFLKNQEYGKADKYYEEASRLEENPVTKGLYYYEWSTLAMAQENFSKVRELSNQALKFNPTDGRPYLVIGKAYAASKNIGEDPIEQNSVYWVAVDCFYKAKQVDTSLSEEANNLIATYSKYFPNKETWFMAIGSGEGDEYKVGGWINITTKVRF
jgi:tetratricopeptide (TPR) repeat protein